MVLCLEVVTGVVKDFKIRKYNIRPFLIHISLLNANFHIKVFAKNIYNSKYKLENVTNIIPRTGIVLDLYFCCAS